MLSQYPFRKVVYGLKDPNPMVNGGGEKLLCDRGIEAVSWASIDNRKDSKSILVQLEDLAEHFLTDMSKNRAFIALKVATTSDGFMADTTGPTKWITGEESRRHVHYLRAGFDAILVGKNTFLKDNPALNVRHEAYPNKTLKVIVADSKGEGLSRLADSTLYKSHDSQNIYWIVDNPAEHAAYKHLNINLVAGPVQSALQVFYEMGLKSIFVEGGAEIYAYFMKNNLVDRLYHFTSPNKFVGVQGLHWLQGFSNRENPLKFKSIMTTSMGADTFFSASIDRR